MRKKRIKNDTYREYIEGLPCYLCGFIPDGERKLYSEYQDKYYYKPCKNTAHHVDNEMTRTKNDHKILPLCSHYVVSGKGTNNCHEKIHSEAKYKTKEAIDKMNKDADEYYKIYLENKND